MAIAEKIRPFITAAWSANAAGAYLSAALSEIDQLVEMIPTHLADALLDRFQAAFEKAYRCKDAAVCRRMCERYVGKFQKLVEGR